MRKNIVIVGKEGSGKTTLMQAIARGMKHSTFVDNSIFENPLLFGPALMNEPDVICIDEFRMTDRNVDDLKLYSVKKHITAHIKGKKPQTVKSPNFIVCTGDKNALNIFANSRRFMVIEIK